MQNRKIPELEWNIFLQAFCGSGNRLDGKQKNTGSCPAPLDASEIRRGVPNYNYKRGKLTFIRVSKSQTEAVGVRTRLIFNQTSVIDLIHCIVVFSFCNRSRQKRRMTSRHFREKGSLYAKRAYAGPENHTFFTFCGHVLLNKHLYTSYATQYLS